MSSTDQKLDLIEYVKKPNKPKKNVGFIFGLFARATDSSGKVLSETRSYPDGWWISDCGGGNIYFEAEIGDIVMLKPNEETTRVIALNKLLRQCFASPASEDLPAGKNTVQLRLQSAFTYIYSNKLEIEVKEKTK